MASLIDRRDHSGSRLTDERRAQLIQRAADFRTAAGGRIGIMAFDEAFATASRVASLIAPEPDGLDLPGRAQQHLQSLLEVLGVAPDASMGYVPVSTLGDQGAPRTVYLQQQFTGVDIYGAGAAVGFSANEFLCWTAGRVAADGPAFMSGGLNPDPGAAVEALVAAVGSGLSWPGGTPVPVGGNAFAFEPVEGFGDVLARPCWLPLTPSDLRFCWRVHFAAADPADSYEGFVEVVTGETLLLEQRWRDATAAGTVFEPDPGRAQPNRWPFPRPLATHPAKPACAVPAGLPADWVAGSDTSGPLVEAVRAQNTVSRTGSPVAGTPTAGVVRFDVSGPNLSLDHVVMSAFYWCCYGHDFLAAFGARGLQGTRPLEWNTAVTGGRRIRVEVLEERMFTQQGSRQGPQSVGSFADLATGVALIQLLPHVHVSASTPTRAYVPGDRHAGADGTVVLHEYAHSVFGLFRNCWPATSAGPQTEGLDEAFGDYIALTVTGQLSIGAWTQTGTPMRNYFLPKPHFGDLGKPPLNPDDPHDTGEVWCATLLAIEKEIGKAATVETLLAGMKQVPGREPGFLDMRDAMLDAVDGVVGCSATGKAALKLGNERMRKMWQVFADRGMGDGATSDGATLDPTKIRPSSQPRLLFRRKVVQDRLSSGWDSFASMPAGNLPWASMSSQTGDLVVDRVDLDNRVVEGVVNATRSPGFTSLRAFDLGGTPALAAYDPAGRLLVDTVDPAAGSLAGVYDGAAPAGAQWLVPLGLGPQLGLASLDQAGTSVGLDRIDPIFGLQPVGSLPWNGPAGTPEPLLTDDGLLLVAYDAVNGAVSTSSFAMTPFPAFTPGAPLPAEPGWSTFAPFLIAGQPHYVAYSAADGRLQLGRLGPQGPQPLAEDRTLPGWTAVVPIVLEEEPAILFYDAVSGVAEIDVVVSGTPSG